MRPTLTSSIAVSCATALAISSAVTALTAHAAEYRAPSAAAGLAAAVPGTTRTIPLAVPATTRSLAAPGDEDGSAPTLAARGVEPFSLLGVTWDDPSEELPGSVQVRTRAMDGGGWSPWRELNAHDDDSPDPGTGERSGPRARGGTAPLWVGRSDAVQLRAEPAAEGPETRAVRPAGDQDAEAWWPSGMRLDMVDPDGPGATPAGAAGFDPDTALSPDLWPDLDQFTQPALPADGNAAEEQASDDEGEKTTVATAAARYSAPRPAIVTRTGWRADESLRERAFLYTGKVKTVFVHHTVTGNNYACSQAPSLIRAIYRYHVKSSGWRDIGYNFLIDRCGTIYEGRAGGVANAVMGAHTYGFNRNSSGVAVLGTFTSAKPSTAAVNAIAKLSAWKLGLSGVNAAGSSTVVAGGGKYKAGTKVKMKAISGHRDGFNTECPGSRLYAKLASIRTSAARLQRK